ncbi:CAP domain-containing protein [Roseibacillus ishigakijimensis]|uniref:CAP domain-containing protein n=1 Tax=Roseibacillus ishigakijimensis TaxID=454146 RepID=A0A934VM09_9BACT|nr:CAP domain-containing protein [Roseibacillus ishigakijimensis]MBK1833465.1 CAP domain-containing protein [Roseibacillus ishigakijimensis]
MSYNAEEKLALEIMDVVNEHRRSKGLRELNMHRGLNLMAKKHSDYMRSNAGSFSLQGELITHYGFEARRTLAYKKYRMETLSENVIASYDMGQDLDLARKMVDGWLRSPNHRRNMEMKWTNTGIGVSFDAKGRAFVAQLFGSAPSKALTVGGPMSF